MWNKQQVKQKLNHLFARDALIFAFCAFVSATVFCLIVGTNNIAANLWLFIAMITSPFVVALACYAYCDKGQNVFSYRRTFAAAGLTAMLNPILLIIVAMVADLYTGWTENSAEINNLVKDISLYFGIEIVGAVIGLALAIPGAALFVAVQKFFILPNTQP